MRLVILLTTLSTTLFAADTKDVVSSELAMLDTLIEATKKSLANEITLKEQITRYQKIQELYLLGASDNDTLYKMAHLALRILETIKESHLTQNFDPAFLSELTLISRPATKPGIPK